VKLERKYVEKPWGRTALPPMFDPPEGKRIGEVWFTGAGDLPLLAKYIFTSERLSIQVHPNDAQASARGLANGKTECWYILDVEPGAVIGLGLTREATAGELRSAALDGSIEQLIDWRLVKPGDFILVPPGTVHAIGGGISLLEFQQNADVTYRLYDYGRPRELHLDDGVSVANPAPFDDRLVKRVSPGEERTLVDGPPFTLVSAKADALTGRSRWIMPIEGRVRSRSQVAEAGDCLVVDAGEQVEADGAWILVGATA
jgi:mannose-6-phosphate isomerase